MPAVHLFHVAVDVAQVFLLASEVSLGFRHHQADDQHGSREHHQGGQGHDQTDPDHHDQNAHQGDETRDHLGQTGGKCLVDGLNVVDHSALDLAVGLPVEIFQGKPVQLLGHLVAEGIDHLLGDARHDPPLEHAKEQAQSVQSQEHAQDHQQSLIIDGAGAQAAHHFIRCRAQDRRGNDAEHRTCHGADQDDHQLHGVGFQITRQSPHGSLEVFCFFARHHLRAAALTSSAGPAAVLAEGAVITFCHPSHLPSAPPGAGSPLLASSSSLSWDRAISW